MELHTCNLGIWENETGESLEVSEKPRIQSEFMDGLNYRVKTCLKKETISK